MKVIGLMYCFLGPEVWPSTSEVFLWHGKYMLETLKRFQMIVCKSMVTPMMPILGCMLT